MQQHRQPAAADDGPAAVAGGDEPGRTRPGDERPDHGDAERGADLTAGRCYRSRDPGLGRRHPRHGGVGDRRVDEPEADPEDDVDRRRARRSGWPRSRSSSTAAPAAMATPAMTSAQPGPPGGDQPARQPRGQRRWWPPSAGSAGRPRWRSSRARSAGRACSGTGTRPARANAATAISAAPENGAEAKNRGSISGSRRCQLRHRHRPTAATGGGRVAGDDERRRPPAVLRSLDGARR